MAGNESAAADRRPLQRALVALCVTQITSWGILYYALPVALAAVTADTGWTPTTVTAAFSTGLIVSAIAGVPVGRLIDRRGPRLVMTAGSVLAVPSLVVIALAPNLAIFFAGWVLAGLAMSGVLYPPAFAALTRWYGPRRVRALTTVTLAGGLASTVFAPVTNLLLHQLSWRATFLVLAGVIAVVTVPLHALLLTPRWPAAGSAAGPAAGRSTTAGAGVRTIVRSREFLLLSGSLTVTAFGLFAASLTLIPLLTGRGFSPSLAAVAFGLIGVGQLLGRIGFAPLGAHTSPSTGAGIILGASAVSVALLAVLPGPAGLLIAVAVLLGVTRGATTLLQATVVADRWGTARYGTLAGYFIAPITVASALAPWAGTAIASVIDSYPVTDAILAVLVAAAAVTVSVSGRSQRPVL